VCVCRGLAPNYPELHCKCPSIPQMPSLLHSLFIFRPACATSPLHVPRTYIILRSQPYSAFWGAELARRERVKIPATHPQHSEQAEQAPPSRPLGLTHGAQLAHLCSRMVLCADGALAARNAFPPWFFAHLDGLCSHGRVVQLGRQRRVLGVDGGPPNQGAIALLGLGLGRG